MKNNIETTAEIFRALSNPTRLRIVLGLIEKNECNVNKMVEGLNISQPNVSQNLSVLKSSGIIQGYRKGNQICYKVINEFVIDIAKTMEKNK